MSSVANLQYGNRFGGDVAKLIKSSTPSGASLSDAARAKYTRWFSGDDGMPEPMATSSKKFVKITSDMAASEVAAATRLNLGALGSDASDLITSKLPPEHKMRRSILASVLPEAPFLGTCKFGEILTDRGTDKFGITQIFIANFDGELNTAADAKFCKPVSRKFDQMFFGVHIIVDRLGNPVGFNRSRGQDGLAFKTKDIGTALYQIASASTGLPIEDLMKRAALKRGEPVPAEA